MQKSCVCHVSCDGNGYSRDRETPFLLAYVLPCCYCRVEQGGGEMREREREGRREGGQEGGGMRVVDGS